METKPAIYTSEFWLTVAIQLIFLLNTVHIWTYMPVKWSALVQAIVLAAYSLARGWAKSGVAPDPAVKGNYTLVPRNTDFRRR